MKRFLVVACAAGGSSAYQYAGLDRSCSSQGLCSARPAVARAGCQMAAAKQMQCLAPEDSTGAGSSQTIVSADVTPGWIRAMKVSALSLLTGVSLLSADAGVALAENELTALASSKSTSEIVDTQCFATSCKQQTKACAENGDCTKGLLCTAKCMGDAQCAVGCFARYGNADLDNMLQCTIEDEKCIKIAIMEPGPDGPLDAPLPPKPLVPVTPKDMGGKWYKVMGWNPNYDCFDCQRNSFSSAGGATQVAADIGSTAVAVEVEYSMPRSRIGQEPSNFHTTLYEKLMFDKTPGSRRTAHTEGKMFGLTFWENWYVIGQNKASEPQFRFVYYTGKTLQNRYEGAFVYARTPEIPREALPSIYKIARESGMDPTGMCCIDNKCFSEPQEAAAATPPPFTPVAIADTGLQSPAVRKTVAADLRGIQQAVADITEYLEDPKPPAAELFSKQRKMSEIREYDINGYRVPTSRQ